ncbi:TlpA family protein disulfide reductase [Teredinibacter haidensis]|uniref:TlpA family protein disulfide reductase n=1 Tax=Teredinibacter haidensis TaxID=2731755 RepID=UPI000948A4A9|nr:TlpA disulfide reductase family protein [Teredinibacter haidensis]
MLRATTNLRIVTAALLWLLVANPSQADNSPQPLAVGMTAPNWMMSDIEGDMHSLYAELEQGNEVIIVFWASWCKFCRELLPEINLFQLTLTNDPVKIFAMNIWEDGDPVGYFDSRDFKLPLILNADAIARRYAVEGTPGVVFIGKDKTIRYLRQPGEDSVAVMRQLQALVLEKYLKK